MDSRPVLSLSSTVVHNDVRIETLVIHNTYLIKLYTNSENIVELKFTHNILGDRPTTSYGRNMCCSLFICILEINCMITAMNTDSS